jgi:Flp pilus assembly pilin Flp
MTQPRRSPDNREKKSENRDCQPLATGHWSLVTGQGQSTLEYAVFTAVVAAALIAMQVYVRRSIQANLKTLENQVNAEAIP